MGHDPAAHRGDRAQVLSRQRGRVHGDRLAGQGDHRDRTLPCVWSSSCGRPFARSVEQATLDSRLAAATRGTPAKGACANLAGWPIFRPCSCFHICRTARTIRHGTEQHPGRHRVGNRDRRLHLCGCSHRHRARHDFLCRRPDPQGQRRRRAEPTWPGDRGFGLRRGVRQRSAVRHDGAGRQPLRTRTRRLRIRQRPISRNAWRPGHCHGRRQRRLRGGHRLVDRVGVGVRESRDPRDAALSLRQALRRGHSRRQLGAGHDHSAKRDADHLRGRHRTVGGRDVSRRRVSGNSARRGLLRRDRGARSHCAAICRRRIDRPAPRRARDARVRRGVQARSCLQSS